MLLMRIGMIDVSADVGCVSVCVCDDGGGKE